MVVGILDLEESVLVRNGWETEGDLVFLGKRVFWRWLGSDEKNLWTWSWDTELGPLRPGPERTVGLRVRG